MKKRWSQIHQLILEGKTAKWISEEIPCSAALVYKVAKFYQIQVTQPPHRQHPQQEQIVQRVLETGNGYSVDKEFGLSPGSAKKMCRRLGVSYELRLGRPKENLTKEELLEKHPEWKPVVELFLSGYTHKEIAQIVGITSACEILHKLGYSIGKGGKAHPKKLYLPHNLEEMYNSGLSCKEIGQMFGTTDEVVRRRLVRMNVPRRVGKASGSKNPQWKGGMVETMHYYRRQAYEVAAICLKRVVPRGSIIHHIDENPKNNNPRNLILFPSQKNHARFHQIVLKSWVKAGSEEAILLALENDGVPLPEPDFPIELLPDTDYPDP